MKTFSDKIECSLYSLAEYAKDGKGRNKHNLGEGSSVKKSTVSIEINTFLVNLNMHSNTFHSGLKLHRIKTK